MGRGLSCWQIQIYPRATDPTSYSSLHSACDSVAPCCPGTVLGTRVPRQHAREGGTGGPGTSPEVIHRLGWGDSLSVAGWAAQVIHGTAPLSQQLQEGEKSFLEHAQTKSRFGLEQRFADSL